MHFYTQLFPAHNSISSNQLRVKTWCTKIFSQASTESDNPQLNPDEQQPSYAQGAHIRIYSYVHPNLT